MDDRSLTDSRKRYADPDRFHVNSLTLKFVGPLKHLEPDFLYDYALKSLPRVRATIVLGFLLFAGFGPLDAYLIPEVVKPVFIIRYAIVAPFLLLMLPLSYMPKIHKFLQPLSSGVIVICGLAIIIISLLVPNTVYTLGYAFSLIFIFLVNFTVLPARFVWATAASVFIMAIFNPAMFFFTDISIRDLFAIDCFFWGIVFTGMFACYSLERSLRKDFFLSHLLEREREKLFLLNEELAESHEEISEINTNLENLVMERTAELTRKNEELGREIEERERLQKKMLRAERMEALGVLAGGIAHDLNNILSGLIGLPALVIDELPPDHPMKDTLLTIQQSGLKASRIVQDLLSLARREVATPEPVDLNQVIEAYLSSPEHDNLVERYPRVEFQVDLAENLPMISGSAAHLLNVMTNLVFNAAESMEKDGGIVSISTDNRYVEKTIGLNEETTRGNYVVVTLSDTGRGIPQADIQQIFDPFFTTKAPGRSGSGLGLTIVLATVEDHGGYIDVNTRENEGTTFELYFPV